MEYFAGKLRKGGLGIGELITAFREMDDGLRGGAGSDELVAVNAAAGIRIAVRTVTRRFVFVIIAATGTVADLRGGGVRVPVRVQGSHAEGAGVQHSDQHYVNRPEIHLYRIQNQRTRVKGNQTCPLRVR